MTVTFFFAPAVEETDDMLLQRVKEVESRFTIPCGDEYEFSMLRYKSSTSNDMFQLIQQLTEDRKQLAYELSSEIKARVTERFAAKEQYKQLKKELDNRTRRLEKEKSEVQTTLEGEMDRRSDDWSIRLSRFQSEEERLHERVRELAEQNVSFQREVTSLGATKAEALMKAASLETQNSKLNDDLEKLKNEHEKLHYSSTDLQARFAEIVEERDHIREYLKAKEGENKALHKVIARLQTTCNEQERTITGMRQGCIDELGRKFVEYSTNDKTRKLQMELIRLTGVEQKLRGEIRSCNLEVKSLRQENIALLNRLQGAGNGASFSSIRLDQELQARVDNLQMQGLSLLDKISQLCTKLLDLMKHKRHENEYLCGNDVSTFSDYIFEYQSIKGGIEGLKLSLKAINSILAEKQNAKEKSGEIVAEGSPSKDQTVSYTW
jgi:DNA repair exonuclease SbcCD ATPase subunit